jgi:hypothetical protein
MVPTAAMDSSTSRLGYTSSRKQVLKGFAPLKPFKVAANLATIGHCTEFHWPSLSELNDEIAPFQWHDDAEF